MASDMIAPLPNRGVVSVSGADAGKLLQGLITNDMDLLARDGDAIHAGLLSPQGKILFEFLVVKVAAGLLIDVARDKAGDLVKRLTMYKLRADVALADMSSDYAVFAGGRSPATWASDAGTEVVFKDPRSHDMGYRVLVRASAADGTATNANGADYDALRVALCIPEGGLDYDFGDAYPHEANFDLHNGVSFTKGCYVGQEIVSRMQNKTVVRKRIVTVTSDDLLTRGADIRLGDVTIGRVGTVDGRHALAMLRLDRAVEAHDKGVVLTAAGVEIVPDAGALESYRKTLVARASLPGVL